MVQKKVGVEWLVAHTCRGRVAFFMPKTWSRVTTVSSMTMASWLLPRRMASATAAFIAMYGANASAVVGALVGLVVVLVQKVPSQKFQAKVRWLGRLGCG